MNYDTLDCLIPPVRKRSCIDKFTKEHNNIRRGFRQSKQLSSKLATRNIQFSQSLKNDVKASSSLDIKKITNKLLHEQFSISNLITRNAVENNFNFKGKNRNCFTASTNVIKITVFPVSTETHTSKIAFKRNRKVKKIHQTVSNTKSSTKSSILCSPKHQRQIYDIRETTSADLFKSRWEKNSKLDELSLNRMTFIKTITSSLSMSHKGSQRLSQESHKSQVSPKNIRKKYNDVNEGCTCSSAKINNVLDDMYSRKNRVTIFGRLGINEDDQYILNCAATVDNKPIETSCIGKQHLNIDSVAEFENNGVVNNVTRATQANIDICLTTDKMKNTMVNNKDIQCHCRNTKNVATVTSICNFKESTGRKSPLIVISVYPRKDSAEDITGDLIQINQVQGSPESDKNMCVSIRTKEHKSTADQKSVTKCTEKRMFSPPLKALNKGKIESPTLRNRSPSPPIKYFNNRKIANKTLKNRSGSPEIKATVKENSKNRLSRRNSRKFLKSPEREDLKTKVDNTLPTKDKSDRNSLNLNVSPTSKVNPFKNSYGGVKVTNTKKNMIKKAIVDSYTQQVLMPVKGQDTITRVDTKPRANASSVTINIDGENERYRVLFLQDKLSTDLNIKKTLKTHKQEMLHDLKHKKKANNNQVQPGIHMDKLLHQLNNSQALSKDTSGIKIRDSLEMRHWREDTKDRDKNIIGNGYEPTVQLMNKNVKKYENNEDYSAPVKHYRGDQCCVPNPTVRDQEIRDLLGIKKPRSGKAKFVQEILPEFIEQKLHCNLYPQECMRNSSSLLHQHNRSFNKTENKININDQLKFVSASTQCEESTVYSYKQMILNRNIQVFLQVEQFTKQKPIMLSRKQYEKVKKTIQKRATKKFWSERRRWNNSTKCSVVSIGELRETRKQLTPILKISRTVQADLNLKYKESEYKEKYDHEQIKPFLLLHAAEITTKDDVSLTANLRQVVSTVEMRNASMTHLRHVTFSSSDVQNKPGSIRESLREKSCPSIQTIFKGHRKCVTPNLGTSAYSLYSNEEIINSDNKYALYSRDEKPKKPFLRRLMSCLVMRSNRPSEAIWPRQYDQLSLMNSFDSYHVNTSLGALDLTSSLYDTSASFYSNHTVYPIARMKRGFLSSVRGFLTNLKSH